ncbi:MAG TPA: ABC transporter permease [Thermomicrobiaceae bacterium]|nr:ABC transporter permease [Thermomicrobiaceae bacterium]
MSPSLALNWMSSEAGAIAGAWLAKMRERLDDYARGYFAVWVIRPIFDLSIAALIYAGGGRDLIPYLVVAMSANSLVWVTLFRIGEILDRERINGTLVSLFLTPCSRLSWLVGFAAAGVAETTAAALAIMLAGRTLFGVRLDPDFASLAVSVVLFVLALCGLGLILSGIGLLIKKANELANLVFPVVTLLGGAYYPVSRLPLGLRIPARALPLGYGMEAITGAALHHASLGALAPSLLPLAGFAVALPLLGAASFGALERLVRRRGEIDLY